MKARFDEATRVVVSSDQISAPVHGEVVILGMTDGVYYGLDAVGRRVWDLMQEPRTLGDIASVLATEFDVTRDRALADLISLAGDLSGHGLIEVIPAGPTA